MEEHGLFNGVRRDVDAEHFGDPVGNHFAGLHEFRGIGWLRRVEFATMSAVGTG